MKLKKKKPKKTSALTFIKVGEKKKLKLFNIEWMDHAVSGTANSWRAIDEVAVKSLLCHSVGFVVDETKEAIALAANVGANGTVAEITTILKSCIVTRKEL